ncbi:helix-turn-helix domain-containing protein [Chishuiella sp.]|uniref:helix-turn-helix domain-containing protein n=1 Tax=Chishuiella sp. TaxID=1969467 RepID=UPI0028B14C20|nr:helix-turn-helix domain-containing protein [Chishuiella sp.]
MIAAMMEQMKLKQMIQKEEDHNLSFRIFELSIDRINDYSKPHQKDHFCVLIPESGNLELLIEDKLHVLKKGKVSVIFPEQVHSITNYSEDVTGKIILFEEVMFCSDILKNELSAYNVNLSNQLNCTVLPIKDYQEKIHIVSLVKEIYENPSQIKKEQARFYIKILLLSLIESIHGQHPVLGQHTNDQPLYIQFKKMLNESYKEERTVQYYADKLFITTKKLNSITKRSCGETAINAIHNRILTEIKRQLMFSDISHKEIAFDLGFNSPAALNKFVKAKLNLTPTQLQQELAQKYNT